MVKNYFIYRKDGQEKKHDEEHKGDGDNSKDGLANAR